jgi:tetratricopeptide (TPR) repeat protein
MDYAVGLILTGNYEEAIKRLQDLENERPGQYEIAVNLGTALELAGQSSAALGWIKEGIRRNPYSHNATEWLHVMILEAQLKAATNKSLFRDKTLLGLTPEQLQGDDSRVIRIGNEQKSIAQIDSALHYQLQERLSLVKKKEPILAGLLMDAATMEATRRNLEEAIKILDLAEKYGYPSGTITHAKKKYRALIKNNKQAKEEL